MQTSCRLFPKFQETIVNQINNLIVTWLFWKFWYFIKLLSKTLIRKKPPYFFLACKILVTMSEINQYFLWTNQHNQHFSKLYDKIWSKKSKLFEIKFGSYVIRQISFNMWKLTVIFTFVRLKYSFLVNSSRNSKLKVKHDPSGLQDTSFMFCSWLLRS